MKRLAAFWLFFVLLPHIVAQSRATGGIQGTVLDSTGSVIVAAQITQTNTHSGAARHTESDESGQFRFSGLPVGNYILRLEKEGFGTVLVQTFPVSVGQTVVHR